MIVPTYETTAREQEIIINNQRKEIERLNNIIKEVREYINKIPTQPVIRIFKKELLEILDKENNNEIIDYINKGD